MPEASAAPMVPRPGRLVVVGDVAWDIFLAPGRDLIWGTDVHGTVDLQPGGSAANVAVWARRAGARVTLVGKIGDDPLGDLMRRHLVNEQLADGIITVPGGPTTRVGVLVSPQGDRAFVMDHKSLLGFEPADCPASLLDGADGLFFNGYGLFSSRSADFLIELLAAARQRGVFTAFDPSSFSLVEHYGPERLKAAIGPVDAILANEEEITSLAQDAPASTLLASARMLVVKQGSRGATVMDADGVTSSPAHPALVVDTTGAGDAFGGAFLASHLGGASLAESLARANRYGAHVVSRLGAQPEDLPS